MIQITILDIVVVLYSLIKNRILYSKTTTLLKTNQGLYVSIFISLATFITYHILKLDYSYYNQLSFIKGSIQLPSQTIIFITVDFFASLTFALYYQKHQPQITNWRTVASIEIFKLVLLYILFSTVITHFWSASQSFERMGQGYWCLKYPLVYELAAYYREHQQFPNHVSEFTRMTTNPLNNSNLTLERHDFYLIIKDDYNNEIVNTMNDLIGIQNSVQNENYFNLIVKQTQLYCPSYQINNR